MSDLGSKVTKAQFRRFYEEERAEFKNFHRVLCERFGYGHDEIDWRRDQLSLIEHIAKMVPQRGADHGLARQRRSEVMNTEERAELQARLLREERARIAELRAALFRLQAACVESGDMYYAKICTDALGITNDVTPPLPRCPCESVQQCRGSSWAAMDGMRCAQAFPNDAAGEQSSGGTES